MSRRTPQAGLGTAATLVAVCCMSLALLGCGSSSAAPPATLTPTNTRPPTPTSTSTPNPDPLTLDGVAPGLDALRVQLANEIDAFKKRVGGDFAVAVTDLQTGQTVSVNGNDTQRIPGCTMNFFVLLQVVGDVQWGMFPEKEVGSFIARTVYASDPGTAHYLLRKSGGGNTYGGLWKMADMIKNRLQLRSAVYNHPPANATYTIGAWQENRISPLDFNRALTMLYEGKLLDPKWTAYLLDKMSRVKPGLNHLIPRGVTDPKAIVSHKNGYIDYRPYIVDNDIGIVQFERGGKKYAYALTFWSQDNPWVLSDAPLGQKVSSLVWQYFSTTYT